MTSHQDPSAKSSSFRFLQEDAVTPMEAELVRSTLPPSEAPATEAELTRAEIESAAVGPKHSPLCDDPGFGVSFPPRTETPIAGQKYDESAPVQNRLGRESSGG